MLLGTAACGDKETGGSYQAVGSNFVAALFEERFDDARAMASADYAEEVSTDVDAFAVLFQKYEFQEAQTEETSDSTWSSSGANTQTDRKLTYYYQFRAKGTEAWKIGWIEVRVLSVDGSWGIAGMVLARPDK
jgi:hypothetical protein